MSFWLIIVSNAMAVFPVAVTSFKGKAIKILEAKNQNNKGVAGEVLSVTKDGIEIATGEGSLLVKTVKPEGKGKMRAFDWSNGAGVKVGDKFGE